MGIIGEREGLVEGRHTGQMSKKVKIMIIYVGWKPGIRGEKKECSMTVLYLYPFLLLNHMNILPAQEIKL